MPIDEITVPSHILTYDDISELRKELIAALEKMEKSIKERVDRVDASNGERVGFLKDSVALALAGADKATTKQDEATARRFEDIEKFRRSQEDQQRLLMPRAETVVIMESMTKELLALESRLSKSENTASGKASGSNLTIVYLSMGVMALISVASLIVAIVK